MFNFNHFLKEYSFISNYFEIIHSLITAVNADLGILRINSDLFLNNSSLSIIHFNRLDFLCIRKAYRVGESKKLSWKI